MKKLLGILVLGLLIAGCQPFLMPEDRAQWDPVFKSVRVDLSRNDFSKSKQLAIGVCASRNLGSSVRLSGNTAQGYGYIHRYWCEEDLKKRNEVAIERAKAQRRNMIAYVKGLCRDLGVPENTEQFSNCTTKLVAAEIGKPVIIKQERSSFGSNEIEGPIKCIALDPQGNIRCKDANGRTISHK